MIVFALTRIMPGSPMERAMQRASQGDENTKSSAGGENQGGLSEEGEGEGRTGKGVVDGNGTETGKVKGGEGEREREI